MEPIGSLSRLLLSRCVVTMKHVPVAGLKSYTPYIPPQNVEYPERHKLKIMDRVPQIPQGVRVYKMQKRLKLMRGPELYHNTLLHRQYGIIALGGGRLMHKHLEMIRMTLIRYVDFNKVFALWRVQTPWQPVTKKSQGQRMGSGKGAIDYYVTPVRAGRVIVEVAGNCEFFEVERCLTNIANMLPFKARAVSQTILDEMAAKEKKLEEENKHPWTWKYMVQNNMIGCHKWISPFDKIWFNKYL